MNRLLDALLGPHCPHQCGQRIYPRDLHQHLGLDHAGDPDITVALLHVVRDPANAAAYLRRHRTPRKGATT